MDRRTFLRSALVVAIGSPAGMRAAGDEAAERLLRDVRALDDLHVVDPLRAARRASVLFLDAEMLLPMLPQRSLPLHRAAASAALTATTCNRWLGRPFGRSLGAAEAHADEARDGPLKAEALWVRARQLGEEAHTHDRPSPACSRYLVRALEAAGGSREAAHVRAVCRFQLAWEFAAEGAATTAQRHLQLAAAEWGLGPSEVHLLRGDVLRLLPGHHVDAEVELNQSLGEDCPPVRAAAVLTSLARVHVLDGDVDEAASELEEAFLRNRQAGVRQWRVMGVRRTLPDTQATRDLDAVMWDGEAS
jgi:hypothetical protein